MQGNIWPNQTMQWEIHEQTSQTPATENQQQWTTQIHLGLYRGMVSATLSFNSLGLSLTLNADTTETRSTTLGNASSQLVTIMSDQGIPIISTLVTQHESTR